MMILFWILLIIVLFNISGDHKKYINTLGTSAEEVLKMRYIKGEIDEETFQKMKKTIF